MDENKLRSIVKEVVDEAVSPIKQQLDGVVSRLEDPDTGLEAINRRLDANTGAVVELEKTVKGYADMYKINDSNIRKEVPPEHHLEPFSETA